jgi:hypothetical protein
VVHIQAIVDETEMTTAWLISLSATAAAAAVFPTLPSIIVVYMPMSMPRRWLFGTPFLHQESRKMMGTFVLNKKMPFQVVKFESWFRGHPQSG